MLKNDLNCLNNKNCYQMDECAPCGCYTCGPCEPALCTYPCVCPPGPQGPQGERGDPGPQGERGDPGSAGLSEFAYIYNTSSISIPVEEAIPLSDNGLIMGNVTHVPGTPEIVLSEKGSYSVWFYVDAYEPNQVTLFLNDNPVPGSTYGTSSGALNNFGMVLLTAEAGDILTIRNYTSATPLMLQTMAGGTRPNINAAMIIEKIHE